MATQLRYSDILADILERKHSKCTCPPEYFHTGLNPKPPEPNRGCCQFGPNCQFLSCDNNQESIPVTCEYDQSKCTCFAKCICGPKVEQPVQFLQEPELNQIIEEQNCICVNCYCESEITLLKDVYRPNTDCNKAICACNVCLCQPNKSEQKLLPSNFRQAIKKEVLMTDERIKQECDEIKRLLTEHEESKKKDLEEPKIRETKVKKKKDVDELKIHDLKLKKKEKELDESNNEKSPKKKENTKVSVFDDSLPAQVDNDKEQIFKGSAVQESNETTESTPLKPTQKNEELKNETEQNICKKPIPKKENIPQWKRPKNIKPVAPKTTSTSKYILYSCGCRMPKKKPPRVRYYYSGGTEHYGVKLGHKICVPPLAAYPVPKNMGWLWNLEDPSKGIRERKGWPPGFIGKNIKNMMKVLKQHGEDATGGKGQGRIIGETRAGRKRWRGVDRPRDEEEVPGEEPPLLHIHKKGRTYNITFCPKSSDKDIGPIPIPFSITDKRRDSDSETSESTLEFELHSPTPRLKPRPYLLKPVQEEMTDEVIPEPKAEPSQTTIPLSSAATKPPKKKAKRKSKSIEDHKNLGEDLQTQIQNIP